MTRKTYIAAGTLLIVSGLFLLNFLGLFSWFSQDKGNLVDPETTMESGQTSAGFVQLDRAETINQETAEVSPGEDEPASNQKTTAGRAAQPFPGSYIQHNVTIKSDGVIEKDKDTKWWEEIGFEKRSPENISDIFD